MESHFQVSSEMFDWCQEPGRRSAAVKAWNLLRGALELALANSHSPACFKCLKFHIVEATEAVLQKNLFCSLIQICSFYFNTRLNSWAF